jgi:hypothetical protein
VDFSLLAKRLRSNQTGLSSGIGGLDRHSQVAKMVKAGFNGERHYAQGNSIRQHL